MKDEQIVKYFESVIRPKLEWWCGCYKSVRERDLHIKRSKLIITNELVNIGIDKSRIMFCFDGRDLDVNLLPVQEIRSIKIDVSFKDK